MQLISIVLFAASLAAAQGAGVTLQGNSQTQSQEKTPPTKSLITVPAGTRVNLALTSPVWTKTANSGDPIYSMTVFPVVVDNRVVIPPGTYVAGVIDAMKRPTRWSNHAEFQIRFTKLIFANGYTFLFSDAAQTGAIQTANADVRVQVSFASDILLDNGSQIEMVLQTPLSLDAESAAAAVRQSKPLVITPFRSATRCVPVPGSSDTVFPGTPGTPGTPPIVIPGGPNAPDTVIPGTPGTEGTPPTIIHGSPGIACPGPPVVLTSSASIPASSAYTKSFELVHSALLAGIPLSPGRYQVFWNGPGPIAQVEILQNGNVVVTVQARIVSFGKKANNSEVNTHTNQDGSVSLTGLQFRGEELALSFDQENAAQNSPRK